MTMKYANGAGMTKGWSRWVPYLVMGFLMAALIVGIGALITVARMMIRDTAQELSQSTAVTIVPSPEDVSSAVVPEDTAQEEEAIIEGNPHYLQGDEEDWRLVLVNAWNPYEGEAPELTQLRNDQSVDTRCYADLQAMMDACRQEGLQPLICSSYRTTEKQQELYRSKVNTLIARGYGPEEAQEEARRHVAEPGTSEHHLGLAVDIVDMNAQMLEEEQAQTDVAQWLMENCHRYGFILRYPEDKSEITGVIYEPWHYRYVGREAAREIEQSGLCLEEYLEQRSQA